MPQSVIYILVVHAGIMLIQYALVRWFPSQKKAVLGTYPILLPVGFMFFMPPPPWMTVVLVLGGLVYVFFEAHRTAGGKNSHLHS